MNFASEAGIPTKIRRMAERVRWNHPALTTAGIDPCRLVLEGDPGGSEAFGFLVIGDSGTGRRGRNDPQRLVAELLLAHGEDARFLLHTGDVVYLVGSSEQYRRNFIRPYREWLVGGEHWRRLRHGELVFRRPFLPVLGNHDYYDLPLPLALLSVLTALPRRLLRPWFNLDVGWHGSFCGQAWCEAFVDRLAGVPESRLQAHLATTRSAAADGPDGRRALLYRPGRFTRLPNRYYASRWAGIDLFALDSNTFNEPLAEASGETERRSLLQQRQVLEAEQTALLRELGGDWLAGRHDDQADDSRADALGLAEELDERIRDIDKQLASAAAARAGRPPPLDSEQLAWFERQLLASWRNPAVRGRLLVLHHPPYVTEATKWNQAQTLAVRRQLQQVFDRVARLLGEQRGGRPLLDLAFTGHAHCLELVQVCDNGRGEAGIPWLVCGGGGYSLRRQRPEGPVLTDASGSPLARSRFFHGRHGHGAALQRCYSGLRVDVSAGSPPHFTLTPLVAERAGGRWHCRPLEPIRL
ncbi:MAG: metallophosphoesterase [Synechococcaceae cyanobacterium]